MLVMDQYRDAKTWVTDYYETQQYLSSASGVSGLFHAVSK